MQGSDDIALHQHAVQSSTAADDRATLADDGNVMQFASAGSIARTRDDDDEPAWWEVDLGYDRQIQQVMIHLC